MEGCFMFQWGALFLSRGAPHGEELVLVGGGGSEKIVRLGDAPPMPPHYGKPCHDEE